MTKFFADLAGKSSVSFVIKNKNLSSLDFLQANAIAQRALMTTGIDATQPIYVRISSSLLENERHAFRVCDTLLISDGPIPALTPFALPFESDAAPFPNDTEACTAPAQFSVITVWLANRLRQVRFGRSRHYHLSIDELGGYRVTDNDIAFIKKDSTIANEEVILGPCLILALALRNIFTLHASAWGSADGIIGFIGNSGAGKSTLAAFLDRQFSGLPSRFRRVADDCLPVMAQNGDAVALPHFPQLKLPGSAHYAAENPPRVPVRALVSLAGSHSQDTIEITQLNGKDALLEIVRHTIAAKLFGADLNQQHLVFASQFIGNVPVYRMRYPHRREQLPAVADRLLEVVMR